MIEKKDWKHQRIEFVDVYEQFIECEKEMHSIAIKGNKDMKEMYRKVRQIRKTFENLYARTVGICSNCEGEGYFGKKEIPCWRCHGGYVDMNDRMENNTQYKVISTNDGVRELERELEK